MGRTHPGESNSSYVVEGLIRELLSNSEEASYLRKLYVFYVVPMLNVDGTILGNFRCGVKGYDLNREFYKNN
jgi:cytosolic carboxypeptidase protein 2/3